MSVDTENVVESDEVYSQRTDRGEKLTLQQASEKAGVSKARMRSIANATDAPLRSWKQNLPGLGIKVTYVFAGDLADYLGNRTPRGAGKSKDARVPGAKSYVIKLTDEQSTALAPQFAEMGIVLADRYNYDAEKSKAYRVERQAKQIAELGENAKAEKKVRKAKQAEQMTLPENQSEPDDALTTRLDQLLAE